jgi:hypothetical protein
MNNTIRCPNCQQEFEISDAITHQIEESIRLEEYEKYKKQLEEVKLEAKNMAEEKAKQDSEKEMKDKDEQIKSLKSRTEKAEELELEARKEKREFEEDKRKFELEKQRQLDEERDKIRAEAAKEAEDKNSLVLAQERKKNEDAQKQISELQRRLQQGSQQAQGEVLELELEELLRQKFHSDNVDPVAKGKPGGDVRHHVKTPTGQVNCGMIYWESKRTKDWSDTWLGKIKADVRREGADIPVIVSDQLPEEASTGFGIKDGVWICKRQLIIPVAIMLRDMLIRVNYQKTAQQNRGAKADLIYEYITSPQFRQQIEAVVEVYREMYDQIPKERAAYERQWKQREGQLSRIIISTANFYGQMQGLAGGNVLPTLKGLELPGGEN